MIDLFFVQKWRFFFKHLLILQKTIFLQSRTLRACRKKTRCRRMALVPPFWDICWWQNFPGNLNTWPNTSSKHFFLLPFLQPKKKCPKIYVVTLVLPLNDKKKSTYLSKDRFFLTHSDSCCILSTSVSKRSVLSISLCCFAENSKVKWTFLHDIKNSNDPTFSILHLGNLSSILDIDIFTLRYPVQVTSEIVFDLLSLS